VGHWGTRPQPLCYPPGGVARHRGARAWRVPARRTLPTATQLAAFCSRAPGHPGPALYVQSRRSARDCCLPGLGMAAGAGSGAGGRGRGGQAAGCRLGRGCVSSAAGNLAWCLAALWMLKPSAITPLLRSTEFVHKSARKQKVVF